MGKDNMLQIDEAMKQVILAKLEVIEGSLSRLADELAFLNNFLDTQRSRTPHETDTPTNGAIASPDYAATADCSQCGENISWNGQYWVHTRSNPRHPGVPKSGTYRNPLHL